MAKQAITTGKPALQFWDSLPGPRLVVGWAVWAWFILLITKFIQIGGIIGSTAQSVQIAIPGLNVSLGAILLVVLFVAFYTISQFL